MTRWQTVYRWLAAVGAVVVLAAVLVAVFGRNLGNKPLTLGPAQRRINVVIDLGDDGATSCQHPEIRSGDRAPEGALRTGSTACVVGGVVDSSKVLRWFFFGRGSGEGTVRVSRPVQVGPTVVALKNGAVVPIGDEVRVRCSPDPNERFDYGVLGEHALYFGDGLARRG